MAHKTLQDYGREWLDTLVVAISVAMAFRAYFYEPFNIPTGSMQETLWGNHVIEDRKSSAQATFPLDWLRWAWSGERHVVCTAPCSGSIRCQNRGDGYANIFIGVSPQAFKLPTEVCPSLDGRFVEKGEVFWQGTVVTGDFIFVNRWRWNFFQPQVGEVMIFSTTGIDRLPQGTHYIKRMKARPGETYQLEHPVEGRPTVVTMGVDEYFACGDNFNNSFDSRYWGPVPRKNLRGLGSFVFWPISGWRMIR